MIQIARLFIAARGGAARAAFEGSEARAKIDNGCTMHVAWNERRFCRCAAATARCLWGLL